MTDWQPAHIGRLHRVIPLGGLTYPEWGTAVGLPAVFTLKLLYDYAAAWINPAHAPGAIFWILFLIGPAYWGVHYLSHIGVELNADTIRLPRRVRILHPGDALSRADVAALRARAFSLSVRDPRRALLITIGALLALGALAALRGWGLMLQHWCIAGAVGALYHAARPAILRLPAATHALHLTRSPDPFVPLASMLFIGPAPELSQIADALGRTVDLPTVAEPAATPSGDALPDWLLEADLSQFDPETLAAASAAFEPVGGQDSAIGEASAPEEHEPARRSIPIGEVIYWSAVGLAVLAIALVVWRIMSLR